MAAIRKSTLTASTSVPATDTIEWKEGITRGKAILAQQAKAERSSYELGELAHKVVHPKYRDETLKKFAEAIGVDAKRLEQYRAVWRAWDGAGIIAPGQISFAVLKELMDVPDRAALVTAEPKMTKRRAEVLRLLKDHPDILSEHPDLTCSKQARDFVREYEMDGAKLPTSEEQATLKEDRRWLNDRVDHANSVTAELSEITKYTPERWRQLVSAGEPDVVVTAFEKAAKSYLTFIALYKASLAKASDEAVAEGWVKTSPKRASAPIQVAAA